MKTILLVLVLPVLLCRCDSRLYDGFRVGDTIMVNDTVSGEVISRMKHGIYKMRCGDSMYYYCSEYLEKFND